MEFHDKSNEKTVFQALEKAQKKVGEVVMQMMVQICEKGSSFFVRSTQLFGCMFDVTHKIGTFLKKLLEKNSQWKSFTSEAATAKKKMQQTKFAK